MNPLITFQKISKQHGHQKLFNNLSLGIHAKDRIGIVGPNGSGKSTLLKILAGVEEVDTGEVMKSKSLTFSYASQELLLPDHGDVQSIVDAQSESVQVASNLYSFGFTDLSLSVSSLSGGQRKKIQLAISLSEDTDLLLLDEPSNHLDFDSIVALQEILENHPSAVVMISHDRWLLETYAQKILEVNSIFETGVFFSDGNYGEYLEDREAFLESEAQRINSLKSKARVEEAWLRQGAKARSTKSKHRTQSAKDLITKLKSDRARTKTSDAGITFASSGRRTKDLIEFEKVKKSFADKVIFKDLNIKVQSGMKVGLMGPNGSGKSTFLKIILEELEADSGTVKRANNLNVSYFSQLSAHIDPLMPLQKVLTEDGDSVVFQGKSLHVASWANRFKFDARSLQQPYGSLSGGERAKARIAKLMLEAPDVLLLDEPTNDLDIPTLEVLEDSLIDFEGALILVTHDRFMLNRICTSFLGINPGGGTTLYASYDQWLEDRENQERNFAKNLVKEREAAEAVPAKKVKLTYNEQREYDGMEKAISKAEKLVEELSTKVSNSSGEKMQEYCLELGQAQVSVNALYKRWEELESKKV